jgi:glucan 1,3-beta-glucosidase
MSDLVFDGGLYGMWIGNQQFTSRNITIRGASTAAIYLNWDWAWTFHGLTISNTPVGIDVGSATGSLLIADSTFTNVNTAAVRTGFTNTDSSVNSNNLVLDNVNLEGAPVAVMDTQTVALAGSSGSMTVTSWAQGRVWQSGVSSVKTIDLAAAGVNPNKPAALLQSNSTMFFQKARPAFDSSAYTRVSADTLGVVADGITDATAALQAAVDKCAQDGSVLYLPHGTYRISDTIVMPSGTRILGEAWSVVLVAKNADGKFSDPANPIAAIQVRVNCSPSMFLLYWIHASCFRLVPLANKVWRSSWIC